MIAAGSFVQLPPVPSTLDEGRYCFESDCFDTVFPHHITLTEVVRQHDVSLINAINELCEGNPSPSTNKLMMSLKRPIAPHEDEVYIFGKNFDVNYYNHVRVEQLDVQHSVLKAEDSGNVKLLRKCPAKANLLLKEKCKVIVIRNLQNGLMNGMSGYVTEIKRDTIVIRIDEDPHLHHKLSGKEFEIGRYTFLIRDATSKVVAVRKQFPVNLGYALTVDKAQGRTIDHLSVDCYNFWKPGQLGVAVGRAVSMEGLQVQNYNIQSASIQHPQIVYEFYKKWSFIMRENRACCKVQVATMQINPIIASKLDEQMPTKEQSLSSNEDDGQGTTSHQSTMVSNYVFIRY